MIRLLANTLYTYDEDRCNACGRRIGTDSGAIGYKIEFIDVDLRLCSKCIGALHRKLGKCRRMNGGWT